MCWNREREKLENVEFISYEEVHCILCELPVPYGHRTYEGMCWDCLKKKFIALTLNTQSTEEATLMLHLLDIARIHYKGPMGRF